VARPAFKKFTAFLIILLSLVLIYARGQEYRFRHLTTENGLSSNDVNVIYRDSLGFIWIGTDNGLNRFDGYNIRVFRNDPRDSASITDNVILSFAEQNSGNLLVGTANGGLNHFNHYTETFSRISLTVNPPVDAAINRINVIATDSSGIFWIGTGAGLIKYSKTAGVIGHYLTRSNPVDDSANDIKAFYMENHEKFWMGTMGGLFHFDPVNALFKQFPLVPGWYYPEPFEKIIHCIYRDSKDIFWIGTHWFLYRVENDSVAWIGPPGYLVTDSTPNSMAINAINEHIINGRQVLWMATWGGLNYFDPVARKCNYIFTDSKNPDWLSSYALSTQYMDAGGLLWIGHEDRGVDILNLYGNPFRRPDLPEEVSNLSALSFLMDSKGNFWAGLDDHGLLRLDENMKFMDSYRFRLPGGVELQNCDLDYIYEDSRANIWIGNTLLEEGLFIFDPDQRHFEPVRFNVPDHYLTVDPGPVRYNSFLEVQDGVTWFGTSHGLFRNKPDHYREVSPVIFTINDSIIPLYIWKLLEDRERNTWIGTRDHGLYCLEAGKKEPAKDSFLDLSHLIHFDFQGSIQYIHEDQSGKLWLGTSIGLYSLSQGDTVIMPAKGIEGITTGKPIYGISEDNHGNLWLSSTAGLVRYDPDAIAGLMIRKFDKSDGIPFSGFEPKAFYQSPDGRVFIGNLSASGNGFFFFNPGEIQDNTHAPEVVISAFKVRNESIGFDSSLNVKKHIRLRYDQNFFSFELAALDYVNPAKNQFAYYLEGLEDDWNHSQSRRYINYSGVPPGKYIFRFKASNNDGYWNDKGSFVAVSVLPPPWKSWWAYSMYGLFFVTLLAVWRMYDLRRQSLKHQLEFERIEADKLKELDHAKSRFFANISHEFRTPLTLILAPLDKLITIVPHEAKNDLEIMQRNARKLLQLINQLLLLSRLESGQLKLKATRLNIVELVNEYLQSFESLARHKKVDLVFNFDTKEILVYADREKMEKILFNLLSNAFKYTGEGGRIEVKVFSLKSLDFGDLSIENRQSAIDNRQLTKDLRPKTEVYKDNQVVISIADTGSGIAPDHLPHIFDRFYQADDSTTRLQEGTGIGLSLVKELVELHHGSISVESKPGWGTMFTIALPIGSGHLKEDESADTQSPEEEIRTCFDGKVPENDAVETTTATGLLTGYLSGRITEATGKQVILVVEDNDDLRNYIRGFLEESYRLLEARNGKEGMQTAIEYIPDLMITDVMMPEMDGFELCKRIRADERTSHIPVIMVTALGEHESRLEGLETGADDFISKPFDPLELKIRIRNLLDRRQRLRAHYMKYAEKEGLFAIIDLKGDEALSSDEKFLQKAMKIITENIADPDFSVDDFAGRMAMSKIQLHRKLVAVTGRSPNRLVRSVRLIKAAQMIRNRSGTISEIAFEVGFNNLSWFARCFHDQFGQSPSDYASQPGSK
jgi:signal transduction histidine kinase/DNA-binding response OmpR family regulator/ligand-binding sensor domain-containing protein